MSLDPIVIAGYARTPIGSFQGSLAAASAPELGAVAVSAAVQRSSLDPALVEQIMFGCVLSAGLGQAPARQAALAAGLPTSCAAVTINKMCGSGMQAAMMAHDAIAAGSVDVVIAGGMESMSNAPYALAKHRAGARIGHDHVIDTMMRDGLEDAYAPGKPMGAFAEDAVVAYGFTRAEQDAYALQSLERAQAAIASGAFSDEIAPVNLATRQGSQLIVEDEQPGKAQPAKIPLLKPAFGQTGTITAANASSISDGAAALLITRQSVARIHGLEIHARILGHATHAQKPELFTTAPTPAIGKLLQRLEWSVQGIDLVEVNEAFAVVAMIAARDLGLAPDQLNVNGGACALGHPIGASGARILVTLLAALKARGGGRGVAAVCIGGGEATALALETL